MPDFSHLLSANAKNMKPSAIRELLKLTQQPEIISFAGGLPSPDTFPVEDLRTAANVVFDTQAKKALQYGSTDGDAVLLEELIKFEAKQGLKLEKKNIMIVSASQQALDIAPKLFLDPGDYVIAERPSYLGALQAIQAYSGRVLGIEVTEERAGFDMNELETKYTEALKEGKKFKYIYVIPDFQNPAGFCWSLEKRKELLAFAYKTCLPIVEDSPYREVRFIGEPVPSFYQLDQQGENRGIVIGLKTFSKILSPGVRLGWVIGHEDMVSRFILAKQSMDLCTNVFAQCWLAEYMKTGKLYALIDRTRKLYAEKRNLMVAALEKYFPKHPEVTWTKPVGGLFLWVTLPSNIDTDELFPKAIEKKVAFIAGSGFYYDNPQRNALRLNFSFSTTEQIDEGMKRLADVVNEAMK